MGKPNYRQIYAIKNKNKKRILAVNPNLENLTGIYGFFRHDSNGLKFSYIGQALHLLDRCAEHITQYDHLGLSIKKRGLGGDEGWTCKALIYCKEEQLDEFEQTYIKEYANLGYQLFNNTTGSQGVGKEVIKQKLRKNYTDGLRDGRLKILSEIVKLEQQRHQRKADGTPTKIAVSAQEKFDKILKGELNNE